MTIWNFGSINIDHTYRLPRLPGPGETLAAAEYRIGLGGKGANQSVAAARMGARVLHMGAVGPDGEQVLGLLRAAGVDCSHVAHVSEPTAHAIITVDEAGENAIVIYSGANLSQDEARLRNGLLGARPGDLLLLQNETNLVAQAAMIGKQLGLTVIYSAAPFDLQAARAVLPHVDMLVLNEVEADQLAQALGVDAASLPVPRVLMTRGAKGAVMTERGVPLHVPAYPVTPIDTTGAGDTYLGALAAGLDQGMETGDAMRLAAAAAALQVTRPGTAEAIPGREEVNIFLASTGK